MVSVFIWRIPGEDQRRRADQYNGEWPVEIRCPNCEQWKQPAYESKAAAPEGTIHREQWITGICSDDCWDKYLGVA